jgi:hypothetical protein
MNQEQWRPLPGNAKTAGVLHRHMILTVWRFFRKHLASAGPVARLNIDQNHINRIGSTTGGLYKSICQSAHQIAFCSGVRPENIWT